MDGDNFGDIVDEETQLNIFANTDRIGSALYTGNPQLFSNLMPYFQLSHPAANNIIPDGLDRSNMSDYEKIQLMLAADDDDGWVLAE